MLKMLLSQKREVDNMWYIIKDLLLVVLGAGIGVTIIALVQAGSIADRRIEENWRNEE